MRQLLRSVEELHAAGKIHDGINPDNILVGGGPNDGGALKLWSPANARRRHRRRRARCRVHLAGAADRLPAPRKEVDVWALGCVMAELLTGAPLFTAITEEDDMITQAVDLHDEIVTMGAEAFDGMGMDLSLAGREVLAGMLAFHSAERLTAAEALEHRWFTEEDVVEAKPATVTVEAEHPGSVPCFSEA
ncbi:hypothetical protein HU200_014482 [Digitaria exilis]|uniref:[RNA-polymerase]-subunit kinase n=1 Tax=Digitaria exilis TaxID=1010633 RepID=A0A835KK61_9POAL|nr:hypothetical protein HU200_014482 [Digitaria exilis]